MYGMFLLPAYRSATHTRGRFKMLEIGLGCDQDYGPGASAALWRDLLPDAEVWEAEVDEACLAKYGDAIRELKVQTLVGSQNDMSTLRRWVRESGGGFDAIIDDGGHLNSQILTTFEVLWPSVKEGGVYFIEDLQVGRIPDYEDTRGDAVMSDVIQAWIEQLLVIPSFTQGRRVGWGERPAHMQALYARARHPLPPDVAFVFCQHEACVIGKQMGRSRAAETLARLKQSAGRRPRDRRVETVTATL